MSSNTSSPGVGLAATILAATRRPIQSPSTDVQEDHPGTPEVDEHLVSLAKGINDYINYFIQVLDSKAGAFLAGNVAAASLLLQSYPAAIGARVIFWVAAGSYAVSVLAAALTIIPRLPSPPRSDSERSVLFWGHIAAAPSAREYTEAFARSIGEGRFADDYCQQNFLSAQVLRRKLLCLRTSIFSFLMALGASFIVYFQAR